jgi:IS30 family transposase
VILRDDFLTLQFQDLNFFHYKDWLNRYSRARSKLKCNIFVGKCCMGNYKQLSIEERSVIQAQLTLGFKASWIALGLGRSISTISREFYRNGWIKAKVPAKRGRPAIAGKYRAVLAQDRAESLSTKPGVERRLQVGNSLWLVVMYFLRQGYSPEQIAGTLTGLA